MFGAGRPCWVSLPVLQEVLDSSGGKRGSLGHQSHPRQLPSFESLVNSRNTVGSDCVPTPEFLLCALNTPPWLVLVSWSLGLGAVLASLSTLS